MERPADMCTADVDVSSAERHIVIELPNADSGRAHPNTALSLLTETTAVAVIYARLLARWPIVKLVD